MRRFQVYRINDHGLEHVHFEGVVFSDGTTAVRWCVTPRNTSVWGSFHELMRTSAPIESEVRWLD
jgi:hypothetical protein